jgi:hypothetical protein
MKAQKSRLVTAATKLTKMLQYDPWDARNTLKRAYKLHPKVIARKESLLYPRPSYYNENQTEETFPEIQMDDKTMEITFHITGTFQTEPKMRAWVKRMELKLPATAEKETEMEGATPYVRYIYKWNIRDVHYRCSYRKQGLPGPTCHVVARVDTCYSVACAMPDR